MFTRVTEKISKNLTLDSILKNKPAHNQKAIPETPATISLQQDPLRKEDFEAPENIWAHAWPGKSLEYNFIVWILLTYHSSQYLYWQAPGSWKDRQMF